VSTLPDTLLYLHSVALYATDNVRKLKVLRLCTPAFGAFPGGGVPPPPETLQQIEAYMQTRKEQLAVPAHGCAFAKTAKCSLYSHYTPPPAQIATKSSVFSLFRFFLFSATYFIQNSTKRSILCRDAAFYTCFLFPLEKIFSKNSAAPVGAALFLC